MILFPIIIIILIFFLSFYFIYYRCYRNNEKYIQRKIEEKYKKDKIEEIRDILKEIHPKMNEIKIKEGSKSFTINKKNITLCLKDKEGKYYKNNMLVYVGLHELAHVICDEVGHTDKFYAINLMQFIYINTNMEIKW